MAEIFPQNLKDAVNAGRVIPFAGAGVSMAVCRRGTNDSAYPNWKTFLVGAAEQLDLECVPNEAALVRALIAAKVATQCSVTAEDGRIVAVQVILTNPTSAEIDAFLARGQFDLARMLPEHLRAPFALAQLTYEYAAGQIELKYAVRTDAVPLLPARRS